ncbi:26196_t:CDS:2 [Dentiscutata erythropus]|uniref:26196_t:CDS:1 n=1 Tax=Dentiscutata erythropus TaxID=1348616 RepID=A0A9N9J233_9GLOM|nr:26196_t:CDS:2 [Dentiscutata erythropus]
MNLQTGKKMSILAKRVPNKILNHRKSVRRLSKTGSSLTTTSKLEKEPTPSQPTTAPNKDHQTSQPLTSLATH